MAKVRRLLRILFIDNYDSFTYNVVEMLRQLDEVDVTMVQNNDLDSVSIDEFDGMIISPGPDLPAAAGGLTDFIANHIRNIPTLGICLGHQAIAQHFGAKLVQYKNPMHGEKTRLDIVKENILFKNVPQKVQVGLYHSWYVSTDHFPEELELIAQNEEGIIMAIQHKTLPIYAVQFHPESYMSEHGNDILQNFIHCL